MKEAIKVTLFTIILLVIFLLLNIIFNPVGTNGPWKASSAILDFYKEKENSVDVLYVGSSNVYADISPLEIYNRLGITGYNVSSSEQKVWSSYYLIKDALKTQKPKVIFLETGEFFSDTNEQTEQNIRKAIDPVKLGNNKIDMINDNIYGLSQFDKLSCVFPIFRYHSRFADIETESITKLFKRANYNYKGYIFDKNIKQYKEHKEKDKDTTNTLTMPDNVKTYLSKIIDLCNENDCELVLISMPTPTAWCQEKQDDISTFALQNELNFVDLNSDDNIKIDWDHDSSDGGLHLNIYGAEKIGEYLSNYLDENFELEDHRSDNKYKEWNELLLKYNDAKSIKKAN